VRWFRDDIITEYAVLVFAQRDYAIYMVWEVSFLYTYVNLSTIYYLCIINNGETRHTMFSIVIYAEIPMWMVTLDYCLIILIFGISQIVCIWLKILGEHSTLWFHSCGISVQILNCENSAWTSSIHWLTMHDLNSLLLSEVELEREVAHLSPFLSHCVVLCHYPRASGFISRFQSASPSWLTVSRVLNTNRDPLSRALLWIVKTARSLSLMKKLVEVFHRLYLHPSS